MHVKFVGVETRATYDPGQEQDLKSSYATTADEETKGQEPSPSNLQGNPPDELVQNECPAKTSKKFTATSTIVQVTSLSLLGTVVSCHKAKFTATGLSYLRPSRY